MKPIIKGSRAARVCLIQPVDEFDAGRLDNEFAEIVKGLAGLEPSGGAAEGQGGSEAAVERRCEAGKLTNWSADNVLLAAFQVDDWNGDLSPWPADGISRRFDFKGNAPKTLEYILNQFIPMLRQKYLDRPEEVRFVIGGYSLAGLFSLWAAYKTEIFSACAAVSPSVWFPGWIPFAEGGRILCPKVYLSLGDKEEKVRHPIMRTVGDCIRRQEELLKTRGSEGALTLAVTNSNADESRTTEAMTSANGTPTATGEPATSTTLEWNEGNHFTDPDLRTARGFIWCINNLD